MLNQITAAGIIIFSLVMAADGRKKSRKLCIVQILGGIGIAVMILL